MLQITDLAKLYGDTPVFQQVTLAVAPGEMVAVLGDSGVGKSTLLNCIAGLDTPSRGSVQLDGTEITTLPEPAQARWRRARLGFVFQAFHVLPHLSVADNVALPLLLQGRHDEARVAAMLREVGLEGLGGRAPRTLSGGQLQRVAIARALVHRPALVLADEPTGNLDTQRSREIMQLLWQLNVDRGITVLMVTHEPEMAAYARRVLRFVDGRVASDTPNAQPAGAAAPTAEAA